MKRLAAVGMIGLMWAGTAVAQDAAPAPQTLQPGSAKSEQLTSAGPRLVEYDMYYDLYSFSATPGERIQIDMRSDAFDPYLELGKLGEDGKFTAIAENDDADGLNSRIVQTMPEGGDYLIRARSVGAGSTGAYTIELKRLGEAAPPAPPTPLRAGAPVRGTFEGDTATIVDDDGGSTNRPYRFYTFDARAGQTYTISLKSTNFDPVLDVGALTPLGFAIARTNDDAEGDAGGEQGTDSQLVFRADRSGPVTVRASALGSGATGIYTIELR